MAYYMICDGHGNELANGIPEETIWKIAQCQANERGESVWVSEAGDDDSTEVAPNADIAAQTRAERRHADEPKRARDYAAMIDNARQDAADVFVQWTGIDVNYSCAADVEMSLRAHVRDIDSARHLGDDDEYIALLVRELMRRGADTSA